MSLTYGSLFSGYGGLEQGVQAVLPGRTAWVSDIDTGACKILAHRYPDVPNLGDITAVDWSTVEPVDVLLGGFPCQDLSHAGKRAGLRPGTRSGLWSHMAYAIDQLRPRLVVAENVRGLLSAEAHSDVEPCPWCLGDERESPLRALGAVLGDLADLGYDARWVSLRAADVGAPHGRFRVFLVTYPADSWGSWQRQDDPRGRGVVRESCVQDGRHEGAGSLGPDRDVVAYPTGFDASRAVGSGDRSGRPVRANRDGGRGLAPGIASADPTGNGWDERRPESPRIVRGSHAAVIGTDRDIAQVGESIGAVAHGDGGLDLRTAVTLLPTPAVNDMGAGKSVDQWDEWTAKMKAAHGNGNGHGPSLAIEAQRANTAWGEYEPAIRRWETVLGRTAPPPTETSAKGGQRLSPVFVEWLMGLQTGHVTEVPGLTRNEQLKALGNGVVPQQAAAAVWWLLATLEVAA